MKDPDFSDTAIDPPSGPVQTGEIPEDPRIVEVVREYLSELEQGRRPGRAAYLARYPELSEAIGQCLDGLELVHGATASRESNSAAPRQARPRDDEVALSGQPLGDFQIVRELARGGMGVVYEAVQLSLGRRVALKVLPFAATLDARQLQRFKNEAQAAALLHHTNIVPVFAVGCERGVHFYAMQLIEGQSLATLIKQLRRQAGLDADKDRSSSDVNSSFVLGRDVPPGSATQSAPAVQPKAEPTAETASRFHAQLSTQHAGRDARFFQSAVRLMLQAARALEHAHEFGIVHRDIKPGNLLLDAHGALWITDFGLAQFHTDAGLTRTGDLPGTLRYMSPEQTSGHKVVLDQRTDLYSLGATFYELLTLEPMFDGPNLPFLMHQILHVEPRGLRQIDKSIPPELETIVLKAASKSADDRYRSAGELAADLQRYLDHQPIRARPPSLVDRVRKWSRRHPSIVVAGMLLLAVVAVGMTISNRMIANEQRKTLIEQQKTQAALDREGQRADEAQKRFQQFRQAVDGLVQISDEELAGNPMMHRARQRLLETALAYYQDFIAQREGDPAAQADLAAVEQNVKDILQELAVLQRAFDVDLMRFPAVVDELQLSAEQQERLKDLREEWDRIRFAEGREQNEPAQRHKLAEAARRREASLNILLNDEQLERLHEIGLQARVRQHGVDAFQESDLVRRLGLTSEQRAAIRQIAFEFGGPRGRGRGRGPRGFDGGPPQRGRGGPRGGNDFWFDDWHREEDDRRREESIRKILAMFTAEQTARWNKLAGKPFARIDELPRGGPGGGPPGPPGPRPFGPAQD